MVIFYDKNIKYFILIKKYLKLLLIYGVGYFLRLDVLCFTLPNHDYTVIIIYEQNFFLFLAMLLALIWACLLPPVKRKPRIQESSSPNEKSGLLENDPESISEAQKSQNLENRKSINYYS